MYYPEEIPPLRPPVEEGNPKFHRKIQETRRLNELEKETFREVNAKYLGMISYTDSLFSSIRWVALQRFAHVKEENMVGQSFGLVHVRGHYHDSKSVMSNSLEIVEKTLLT